MEPKNVISKTCLLLIFCSLSWFSVAQTSENNDPRMLLGKWIFESASIADPENPVSFDLYNDFFKFYAEIVVEEDSVSLTDDEGTLKMEYVVDGDYFGIDFPSGEPFVAKWTVRDNLLWMEFDGFHPNDQSRKVKVSLVYIHE